MKKNVFQKLFLLLMISFCLLGLFVQGMYFYGIAKMYTVVFLLILPFLLFLINMLFGKKYINNKYINIFIVVLIIGIGLLLRAYANSILKTMPTSDFSTPHNVYILLKRNYGIFLPQDSMADISNFQRYYAVFPAWFPYMKVVSLLYDIFGFRLAVIKAFNYFLFICSEVLIYFICKKSKINVFFAMFIFACLPSLVLYSNVTTPDHITIFLILLFIYFWTLIIKYRKKLDYKKMYLFSFLNIIVLCLINLFKPLSVFGIIVVICMEILCYLFPLSKKYFNIKNICYVFSVIIFGVIVIFVSNKVLHNLVEKEINVEVVDSTGLYLLWGYSLNSDKEYAPRAGDKIYIDLLDKYDNDYRLVIKEVNGIAKKQIKDNFNYLPSILFQKFKLVYQKESDIFEWASFNSDSELVKLNISKYQENYFIISVSYLMLIFSMMLLSIFKVLINKKSVGKVYYVILLVIIGYSLILVLGGVQPRYKSLIYGPFCLIAASYVDENKKGVKK